MARVERWACPRPARAVRSTAWARAWRLQWFRKVGTAAVYYKTGELLLLYSTGREPGGREALRAELEAHPDGPALVHAACAENMAAWNARVEEANRRLASNVGRRLA